LGQPELWCDNMLYASRMHDIGKIGIPDNILKKPGPLTPAEWLVMQRHPEIGAGVLGGSADSPLYKMAAEVALSHHERYDGTGYPSKLKGEDIPLSARIVAIADFFDAVTSDRCYHQALPPEQAFDMVMQGRSSHFCPIVTDAFLSVSKEILALRIAINLGEIEPTVQPTASTC
jgi:putative two-component system response regulator